MFPVFQELLLVAQMKVYSLRIMITDTNKLRKKRIGETLVLHVK